MVWVRAASSHQRRARYLKEGRDSDSSGEQERARQKMKLETTKRVMKEAEDRGEQMTFAQAKVIVERDYVALHDPDQVAGGEAEKITSLGRGDINSSIGSQWKNRIHTVDAMVAKMKKKFKKEEQPKVKMNVDLKTRKK